MTTLKKKRHKKAIVSAAIVGTTVALMLLVFAVFEERMGHGIALAAFAATTSIIAFSPTKRSAKPKTIFISYALAGTVGFTFSLLPFSQALQAAIATAVVIMVLTVFRRMHPPAIGYAFGFIVGGYGFMEFVLTFPALMGYFIALGVVVLTVEKIALVFGLTEDAKKDPLPASFSGRTEYIVDRMIPYALVLLFITLLAEFLYTDQLSTYTTYLRTLDTAIIILFIADLSFKFRKTRSTGLFVKRYWMDILATIPFFLMFRLFQGMALSFSLVARGTADIVVDGARFARLLRPIARFPRFARLIKHIEDME